MKRHRRRNISSPHRFLVRALIATALLMTSAPAAKANPCEPTGGLAAISPA